METIIANNSVSECEVLKSRRSHVIRSCFQNVLLLLLLSFVAA